MFETKIWTHTKWKVKLYISPSPLFFVAEPFILIYDPIHISKTVIRSKSERPDEDNSKDMQVFMSQCAHALIRGKNLGMVCSWTWVKRFLWAGTTVSKFISKKYIFYN